ncbi:MAG: hypothetical protein IJT30_07355, partial [Muribaculaceae bacterium]|nr:hypothetical protein [Muribaculaceae bacterium]
MFEEVLKHELHEVQRAVLKASKPSSTLCIGDARRLVMTTGIRVCLEEELCGRVYRNMIEHS